MTIESVFFPDTYVEEMFGLDLMKDDLIYSDNFEDIVICQLDDNVCKLGDDHYVLSTFDTLEEVNDFVKEYFEK